MALLTPPVPAERPPLGAFDAAAPPALVNRLEAFLGELVAQLGPPTAAPARPRGRPPILPSLLLWTGLVVCVLRRATAQLDLWRLLTGAGL